MLSHVLPLLLSPLPYAALFGFWLSLYIVWSLARKAYLGTIPTMNAFTFAVAGLWAGSSAVYSLRQLLLHQAFSWHWLTLHPNAIELFAGVVVSAGLTVWYVRRIRYPFWKMTDMVSIGLLTMEVFLVSSWLIIVRSLAASLAAVVLLAALGLGWFCYLKITKVGIVTALHLIGLFTAAAVVRHLAPSWQHSVTGVEWLADWVGVFCGVVVAALRISSRSRQIVFTDIPRGVSQSFRETFAKVIASRRPSTEDGSSRT